MCNFEPVAIRIISMLTGLFGGAIITVIVERFLIKDRDTYNLIKETRKLFVDLRWRVEGFGVHDNKFISSVIKDEIRVSDKAIETLLFNIRSRSKRIKITNTYNKYKHPDNGKCSKELKDSVLVFYDFTKKQMRDVFGKNCQFNNGKELLLYNLQNIINLLK